MKPHLNPVVHEAISAVGYATTLRARLRCPRCGAVGTWKPHGSLIDRRLGDKRGVRRWLCKWCGNYEGPEGHRNAVVDRVKHEWALPEWLDRRAIKTTPEFELSLSELQNTWPWRG